MDKFTAIALKQSIKRALKYVEQITPESTKVECLSAAAKTAGTLEAILETIDKETGAKE